MKAIIMHGYVSKYDAIGNDIAMMYRLLNKKFSCYVYANSKDREGLNYISKDEVISYLKEKENVVLYHHSIYWEEGEQLLSDSKAKIIICYHNITPPKFFEPYSDLFVQNCLKGRKQTKRLIERFPNAMWFAASGYNASDLNGVSKDKVVIRPPFHVIEELNDIQPDVQILEKLKTQSEVKLLSVGRIVPNKSYEFLIEAVRCYCENYNSNIVLYLVGKKHPALGGYEGILNQRIQQYGLQSQIQFVGELSEQALLAYYKGCDIYVCASEHEGFCVPILESQYLELPIVARNFGAVGDTLGEENLDIKQIKPFVAAVHILAKSKKYRLQMCKLGKENYERRFAMNVLTEQFDRLLDI